MRADGPAEVEADEVNEVVDLKRAAVLGDPIVCVEIVTQDERGQGALPFKVLPSPKEPTQAQRDRHNMSLSIRGLVPDMRGDTTPQRPSPVAYAGARPRSSLARWRLRIRQEYR